MLAAFAVAHGPRVVRNLPKRHWEDSRHFRHNRAEVHSLADCFRKPSAWPGGAEATYRPLSGNLYYLAGRTLFANRLEVYHAIDAVVYVVNGVLLLLISRRLLPDPWSMLPPVLFVSRLAHMQVFTDTSEFDTLSYVTFGLLGLHSFLVARASERRGGEVVTAVAFGLALLCKEPAVVWPAVAAAHGWLFDRATAWRKYVAGFVVVAAWAIAYPRILRSLYAGGAPGFVLDLGPTEMLTRYGAYLLAFLNPLVPNVDPEKAGWAMPPRVVAAAESPAMIVLMASLMTLAAVVMARARLRPASVSSPGRVAALGFAWFVAATAPFAVLGDRLFIRYSYAGHAGLALAAGGVGAAIAQHWRVRVLSARHAGIGGEGGIRTPGAG